MYYIDVSIFAHFFYFHSILSYGVQCTSKMKKVRMKKNGIKILIRNSVHFAQFVHLILISTNVFVLSGELSLNLKKN